MTSPLESLLTAAPGLRTSSVEADRVAYARDLWPRHHLEVRAGRAPEHKPAGVVWPETTDDVSRIVRWAKERGAPIVPFGAGSGVCAGVLPDVDTVVLDLKKMDRWRRLDAEGHVLEVEAGQMGMPFEEQLQARGLTLGHFPSSILCSTVGGWVAARSAGQCSGKYGKIEDMALALELVTGDGDVVTVRAREGGPSLVPLVVGSEGTMGVVTSATLRLHDHPTARAFAAYAFPTTEAGWEGMRAVFQAGLRPAVARLYDPFDAMLARRGSVKAHGDTRAPRAPGLGAAALRSLLKVPSAMNELVDGPLSGALGPALLVVIFEGEGDRPDHDSTEARRILEEAGGRYEGEGAARKWMLHRYSVSYRQAPVFMGGLFSDTMEVAAPWSKLGAMYDGVRRALGEHVFVMAHMSHAYPDGCCIYFSFAGSAARGSASPWDAACEEVYDRAWKAALAAVVASGGTIAHHHGVGRSKAPRMRDELGDGGIACVTALMRAFDPAGIMNPGNLLPAGTSRARSDAPVDPASPAGARVVIDRASLLADVDGAVTLAELERAASAEGLTLGLGSAPSTDLTVSKWLADGAPGATPCWRDPADQRIAGYRARLSSGRVVEQRPAPRRSVGPDLTALFLGARDRFGAFERAHVRLHVVGARRPSAPAPAFDLATEPSEGEASLLAEIARELG